MRYLLVDNSNTRTKFALGGPEALDDRTTIIATAEINPSSLHTALKDITWDAAIISSVVPAKAKILSEFLARQAPCHRLTHESKLPIGIQYPNPSQIGADRLANATAAFTRHGAPSIVLDFGTAVTFDVITPSQTDNGTTPKALYTGGVIAPGLASMTEGLARRTALLPNIELEEPRQAIGKSTEQAMLSGAIHGYRGLVRGILTEIQAELGSPATVIATGGDAPLITRGIPEIKHLSPQLTLDGLRIIANHQFQKP